MHGRSAAASLTSGREGRYGVIRVVVGVAAGGEAASDDVVAGSQYLLRNCAQSHFSISTGRSGQAHTQRPMVLWLTALRFRGAHSTQVPSRILILRRRPLGLPPEETDQEDEAIGEERSLVTTAQRRRAYPPLFLNTRSSFTSLADGPLLAIRVCL